jgi:hypothetical protein
MNKRGADRDDVRNALCGAKSCRPSSDGPGRWVVAGGLDLSGDALTAVVVIESGVLVVTVF